MIRILEYDREIKPGHIVHSKCWYLFGRFLLFSRDTLVDSMVTG